MTLIKQIDSDYRLVILRAEFANLTAAQVFDAFTTADGLARWWSPQAEVDARAGGAYHLYWSSRDFHLRGTYLEFVRGERLVFTWQFDHEPETPVRTVEIDFEARASGGSAITLTHGYYTAEDAEERQGHLDGWLYFLERLGKIEE